MTPPPSAPRCETAPLCRNCAHWTLLGEATGPKDLVGLCGLHDFHSGGNIGCEQHTPRTEGA
jgi:RimJ/RimL family protein N-acetyltransferase